ncbi:MAG TPA: recombinase family protein [Planctomycetaceae bacterium]|jgi:DNA invertase Pin-like site-specific DNA recombinase|nr:recombinase family protein [Planctomycetaceae bacterium]
MITPTHPLHGKRIAAYVRVSSDQQDTTRQEQSIKDWAKRNGLKIADWFTDNKGRNPRDKGDKRLNFQRLLALVRTGSVDAIVVDSQDRFGGKDTAEFFRYVADLRDNGCELWSVAQGHLSGEDDASVLTSTLGAMTSKREQSEKGLRSLEGRIKTVKAGLYQGGYPPYGCDVVCFDGNDKPKWRLIWNGNFKRLKINVDGTQQEYIGKDNLPGRDRTDTLRLQPTIRKERIKAINSIFRWFATESISPLQICNRLKVARVDPLFDGGWSKQRVKELLGNPAYIGMPVMNRRAGGRHWEFVDGKMQPVKAIKGKVKAGRKRETTDYIFPDKPVFKPIVPIDIFNAVQKKLENASARYKDLAIKPRSPRIASFYLRNVVYCGRCGRPMRVWNETYGDKVYRSYFCPTYGTHGINNPTGCRSHRVKADVLESLVDSYLKETHSKIATLLSRKSDDPTEPLTGDWNDKADELLAIQSRMQQFNKGQGKIVPSSLLKRLNGKKAIVQDLRLYQYIYNKRKPELEREYKRLDREHTGEVAKVQRFPSTATKAIAKANKRILEIEPMMATIETQLQRVDGRFHELVADLIHRGKTITAIREKVSTEAQFRRKAELVKSVIGMAVCHFQPIESTGKVRQSKLVRVEVFPHDGAAVSILPDGKEPARD